MSSSCQSPEAVVFLSELPHEVSAPCLSCQANTFSILRPTSLELMNNPITWSPSTLPGDIGKPSWLQTCDPPASVCWDTCTASTRGWASETVLLRLSLSGIFNLPALASQLLGLKYVSQCLHLSLLLMCMCFACTHTCALYLCPIPMEVRRWCGSPWNSSYRAGHTRLPKTRQKDCGLNKMIPIIC